MKYLALFPLLLLAACSTKPLPLLPIPKTKEVTPAVAAIRPGLDRANDANASLRANAGEIERATAAARKAAETAAAEARRLAKVGAATQAELDSLATKTEDIQDRNRELEQGNRRMAELLTEQQKDLDEARIAQADALSAAATGDAAQHMLVEQVKALTAQYADAELHRQKLEKSAAVLQAKVDDLRRYLFICLISIGGYVAIRIAKLTPWGRIWLFWVP